MELIVLFAAIAISLIVFGWLIKIVKATVRVALSTAIVLLFLLVVFGIGPDQVFQKMGEIFQTLWRALVGG